jgi:hypothetical protein
LSTVRKEERAGSNAARLVQCHETGRGGSKLEVPARNWFRARESRRKNVKKFLLLTVVVLAVALVALPFGTAQANPPGAPSGKLVFKFNYIAVPPDTHEGVGCGDGHRVFTELGAAGVIVWTLDANSPIHVEDCLTQSIDGDPATIFADAVGTYTIWVRIHGPNKPDNTLDICRSVEDDFTACEIGSVSLSRTGQDRFRFPQKLFDLGNQEFWLLEPGTNFRIAEIRLIQN